jgi:hypothetical protein
MEYLLTIKVDPKANQEQETLSNNFIVIFSKVSVGSQNKHQDFRQLHGVQSLSNSG